MLYLKQLLQLSATEALMHQYKQHGIYNRILSSRFDKKCCTFTVGSWNLALKDLSSSYTMDSLTKYTEPYSKLYKGSEFHCPHCNSWAVCWDALTGHTIHYAQAPSCFYMCALFLYGGLWFHGSITIIDRRWFSDNPWLCSNSGPRRERYWLSASHVLESKLHVALDTHLSLCLPLPLSPILPPPSCLNCYILKTFIATVQWRLTADMILFCWQGTDVITRRAKCHFLRGAP